jgi:predicted RNase H-like HicB family nuclease
MTQYTIRYSLLLQWIPQHQCFMGTSPEWGDIPIAFGASYEEVLKYAVIALEIRNKRGLTPNT